MTVNLKKENSKNESLILYTDLYDTNVCKQNKILKREKVFLVCEHKYNK